MYINYIYIYLNELILNAVGWNDFLFFNSIIILYYVMLMGGVADYISVMVLAPRYK